VETAIATVSLSGTLNEKLEAIAKAQFRGVEIFENDLLSFNGTPTEIRRMATLDMSASRHELLTGDMPHLRLYGLKHPKCAILFPLSPTKVFIATHDRSVEHNINHRNKTEVVRWINDNVVRIAERFVYARTKDHLRFVEKRLRLPLSPLPGSTTTADVALPSP
jgi:hypothetical protein